MRNPVTYYPVPTQICFALNREKIRGKPYEKYFDGNLWVHDEVLPALAAPMDPADATPPTPAGLASLLDAGHRAVENGYCELRDGSGYVASRVPFPGCTGEMLAWWMWWHAVEPARYTLWYPTNHIAATPLDRGPLTRPGLTHEQRYVGTVHHADEYIGPERYKVVIHFVDPAELGFDTSRFAEAGIVAHACARVGFTSPPATFGTMIHLARRSDDGFELLSRYWLGHDLQLHVLGARVPVDSAMRWLGLKRRLIGGRIAYEQLLHDQIEFTHLSTFLADIHAEFGS